MLAWGTAMGASRRRGRCPPEAWSPALARSLSFALKAPLPLPQRRGVLRQGRQRPARPRRYVPLSRALVPFSHPWQPPPHACAPSLVCLARVPKNGRNFEYLSGEDPFLGYTMVGHASPMRLGLGAINVAVAVALFLTLVSRQPTGSARHQGHPVQGRHCQRQALRQQQPGEAPAAASRRLCLAPASASRRPLPLPRARVLCGPSPFATPSHGPPSSLLPPPPLQETKRTTVSENVNERVEFEMYYPPFQGAIDADVGSFMCR